MAGPSVFKEEVKSQRFQNQQLHELVWFSHLEREFQVVDIGLKKLFQWKENEPQNVGLG